MENSFLEQYIKGPLWRANLPMSLLTRAFARHFRTGMVNFASISASFVFLSRAIVKYPSHDFSEMGIPLTDTETEPAHPGILSLNLTSSAPSLVTVILLSPNQGILVSSFAFTLVLFIVVSISDSA